MKINDYYKPTPKNWRRLGDTLLGISTTITGFTIYNDERNIAMIALICGVLGKFLTNFFVDNNTPS